MARRVRDQGAAGGSGGAGAVDAPHQPVARRPRHDGWTPERQTGFLEALASTACVRAAAAAVGMSAAGAYALRARPEAQAFRLAWDAALDLGVRQLADAALSRAIHGVARPVFFQGEQVGERRHYDERLTQFILRLRDPARFGRWREGREAVQHPDGPALIFARLNDLAAVAAWDGAAAGTPALPDPAMLRAALAAMGLGAALDLAADPDAGGDGAGANGAGGEAGARWDDDGGPWYDDTET